MKARLVPLLLLLLVVIAVSLALAASCRSPRSVRSGGAATNYEKRLTSHPALIHFK